MPDLKPHMPTPPAKAWHPRRQTVTMPEFTYTARNPNGQAATGTLTAGNEREVMMLLDQKGLFPVTINPVKTGRQAIIGGKKVKGRVLSVVFAQLADLLHSGVP